MRSAVLALVTLLGVCCTSYAQAQPQRFASAQAQVRPPVAVQSTAAPAAARVDPSHAARVAFEQGRYREALDQYERAYELTGSAVLLYEIGQTADRMRLDATALRAFQLYLERYPDAPNRDEVANRIRALEPAVRTEGADLDAESSKAPRGRRASELRETLIPSPYKAAQPTPPPHRVGAAPAVPQREPLMPSPYTTAPTHAEPGDSSVLDSPWFWVGTGVAAVLVTTLIIVAVGGGSHSPSARTGVGAAP